MPDQRLDQCSINYMKQKDLKKSPPNNKNLQKIFLSKKLTELEGQSMLQQNTSHILENIGKKQNSNNSATNQIQVARKNYIASKAIINLEEQEKSQEEISYRNEAIGPSPGPLKVTNLNLSGLVNKQQLAKAQNSLSNMQRFSQQRLSNNPNSKVYISQTIVKKDKKIQLEKQNLISKSKMDIYSTKQNDLLNQVEIPSNSPIKTYNFNSKANEQKQSFLDKGIEKIENNLMKTPLTREGGMAQAHNKVGNHEGGEKNLIGECEIQVLKKMFRKQTDKS